MLSEDLEDKCFCWILCCIWKKNKDLLRSSLFPQISWSVSPYKLCFYYICIPHLHHHFWDIEIKQLLVVFFFLKSDF